MRKAECGVRNLEGLISFEICFPTSETGARLHTLAPAVTGPDTPDAYLQIMAANARTLAGTLR